MHFDIEEGYQKSLSDFNIYAQKKHEIYAELFRKLIITEGNVADLTGLNGGVSDQQIQIWSFDNFSSYPDMDKLTRDSLRSYYSQGKTPDLKKCFMEWFQEENEKKASLSHMEANNYFWTSVIYLSPEIETEVRLILDKISERLVNFAIWKRINKAPTTQDNISQNHTRLEMIENLKKETPLLIQKVKDLMKRELTHAPYSDSVPVQ